MSAPKAVQDAITRVLKGEQRKGTTTKQAVALLAMNDMQRGGNGYHIPHSMQHMIAMHIYSSEAARQLKTGLPDNVIHQVLSNAPPQLVQVMSKLPTWICLGEGRDAPWVPSLQATPMQWMKNAGLKQKKARQTQSKADASAEMSRYLSEYGLGSLSEAFYSDAA